MIGWNWDCLVYSSDCLRLLVALLGFMTTAKSSSAVLPDSESGARVSTSLSFELESGVSFFARKCG